MLGSKILRASTSATSATVKHDAAKGLFYADVGRKPEESPRVYYRDSSGNSQETSKTKGSTRMATANSGDLHFARVDKDTEEDAAFNDTPGAHIGRIPMQGAKDKAPEFIKGDKRDDSKVGGIYGDKYSGSRESSDYQGSTSAYTNDTSGHGNRDVTGFGVKDAGNARFSKERGSSKDERSSEHAQGPRNGDQRSDKEMEKDADKYQDHLQQHRAEQRSRADPQQQRSSSDRSEQRSDQSSMKDRYSQDGSSLKQASRGSGGTSSSKGYNGYNSYSTARRDSSSSGVSDAGSQRYRDAKNYGEMGYGSRDMGRDQKDDVGEMGYIRRDPSSASSSQQYNNSGSLRDRDAGNISYREQRSGFDRDSSRGRESWDRSDRSEREDRDMSRNRDDRDMSRNRDRDQERNRGYESTGFSTQDQRRSDREDRGYMGRSDRDDMGRNDRDYMSRSDRDRDRSSQQMGRGEREWERSDRSEREDRDLGRSGRGEDSWDRSSRQERDREPDSGVRRGGDRFGTRGMGSTGGQDSTGWGSKGDTNYTSSSSTGALESSDRRLMTGNREQSTATSFSGGLDQYGRLNDPSRSMDDDMGGSQRRGQWSRDQDESMGTYWGQSMTGGRSKDQQHNSSRYSEQRDDHYKRNDLASREGETDFKDPTGYANKRSWSSSPNKDDSAVGKGANFAGGYGGGYGAEGNYGSTGSGGWSGRGDRSFSTMRNFDSSGHSTTNMDALASKEYLRSELSMGKRDKAGNVDADKDSRASQQLSDFSVSKGDTEIGSKRSSKNGDKATSKNNDKSASTSKWDFYRTETPEDLQHKGYAHQVVQGAIEHCRKQGIDFAESSDAFVQNVIKDPKSRDTKM